MVPRNGIFGPFCNIYRMIADTLKVLRDHQNIERIGFIGLMLDDMLRNASLRVLKQSVNLFIAIDTRLRLIQIKVNIGLNSRIQLVVISLSHSGKHRE